MTALAIVVAIQGLIIVYLYFCIDLLKGIATLRGQTIDSLLKWCDAVEEEIKLIHKKMDDDG